MRGWRVTVEEMDKNDEELRESIVQLWPDTGSEDEYDPRSTERWYKFVTLFIASFRQQCFVSYMRRLIYNIA